MTANADSAQKGVSVTICTYNGKSTLGSTLTHLAAQRHTCPIEVLLVDNASTDGTRQFADEWWQRHGTSDIRYRSLSQPIPGKSYAQELAYGEATYEYILICDDDNWLGDTYVETALNIMASHPEIGALGGWCEAYIAGNKPEWFDRFARYYAVSKQGEVSGDITEKKGCLYGAGMMIRKSHWMQLKELGFAPLLTCRKGDSLSSGGDTEYCYALRLLGYRIWYDDRLFFRHEITPHRLTTRYLKALRKAMSAADLEESPYCDILAGREVSRANFNNRLLDLVAKRLIPRSFDLVFGDLSAREDARDYFRTLKSLLFGYQRYASNRRSIEAWYSQVK